MRSHVTVMGNQYDGMPFPGQAFQQRHHFDTALRIECASRLVSKDDLAAVHHGTGDGNTLLLPPGQLCRSMIEAFAKTE